MKGKTQAISAAAAGMSVPTARKWESGPLPSEVQRQPRDYRTRKDPFEDVWRPEVLPLLEADERGVLQAKTIFEELQRRHPGRFTAGQLRTLQRRIRDWRAMEGPDKEVYFPQVHPPGREAAADFTHATELGVTVRGQPLKHLLFQLVLSFSGWTWVSVAFGETFEALVDGLQRALWKLGGVPLIVRLDNLSAATHELRKSGGRALNGRFKDVLLHYKLQTTHINPGKSHENGIVEQRHYRTKSAIAQTLVLRGSSDFDSVESYERWVQDVVDRTRNQKIEARLQEERLQLQPLPAHRVPTYSIYEPVVRRWSTIRIGRRVYSVPSRLIGHRVRVHQHADELEVFYGSTCVEVMPRLRGDDECRIDYRHVIRSLVRKPGAFARYRFREELFPTMTFRLAYDALKRFHNSRADVEYVRVLNLAAMTMECRVEQALAELLGRNARFDYAAVQALAAPTTPDVPEVFIGVPRLDSYDVLLERGRVA